MKYKQLPTQARLKTMFDYDPTGYLIWKINPPNHNLIGKRAGCPDNYGYTAIKIDGSVYKAHRLIYKWHTGIEPDVVDHINHDHSSLYNKDNPYNNRIENLSNGTASEGAQNRIGDLKIHFRKGTTKPWYVNKMINGTVYSKLFYTEQEAINYLNSLENS